ncbi:MAG: HAD-IA family hydrolase [Anaerolineales bacterium]|nr:HAD-IA family hydrolase [Anaerolineales bacterium]
MIQALIFDFDGLILDTETPEAQIWQELYARYGQEFPLDEWVRTVVGTTVANLDPLAQLERLTGLPLDHQALHEQAHRTRLDWQAVLPPLPGVADYLDSARRLGLSLAIASSSPHGRVDGYLRRLEFWNLFDAVICREDAPRIKPDPDLFLAALSALHVRADQALAFEDSPNGVKAAKAAGLRVVSVPNSITARLGPLPADLTLASLSDLALPGLLSRFGDSLALRPEMADDLPGIRLVEEAAFVHHNEADLVDLARARAKSTLSMVAVQDGRVLGHALFTPVTFDPPHPGRRGPSTSLRRERSGARSGRGLGLGPIAILPEFQRTGIGSRLMRAGLEHVRRLDYGFVVLLGDPATYSRFGFMPGRAFGLSSDYGDGDEFQVLELRPGALTGSARKVKYIPEFEETGC